jgi:hypothetical protein
MLSGHVRALSGGLLPMMRLQRLEGARRALVAMRARSIGMHPSATGSTSWYQGYRSSSLDILVSAFGRSSLEGGLEALTSIIFNFAAVRARWALSACLSVLRCTHFSHVICMFARKGENSMRNDTSKKAIRAPKRHNAFCRGHHSTFLMYLCTLFG